MEKLRELRKERKLSMKEFGEIFGLSESTISLYENGKREPDISTLIKFAEFFNTSVDVLLGIQENNPNDILNGDYRETIRVVHSPAIVNFEKMCSDLDEVTLDRIHTIMYSLRRLQRNAVLTASDKQFLFACVAELIGRIELYADRLRTAEEFHEKINAVEQNKLFINSQIEVLKEITQTIMPQSKPRKEPKIILPLFETPVSAGAGSLLYDETPTEWITVQRNDLSKKADYLLRVRGDSMEPNFYDGDLVLIQQTQQIFENEIGIFILNGEAFIKKMGKGELISLNPIYEPIKLHDYDDVRCAGIVLDTIVLE